MLYVLQDLQIESKVKQKEVIKLVILDTKEQLSFKYSVGHKE